MIAGAILTLGLGAFGGVGLLPTLGYGVGEEVAPPAVEETTGGAGWGTPGDFPKRKKRETAKDIRAEIEAVIARFDEKAEVFHVELQQVAAQPVLFKAPAAPDFSPLFAQLSELTAQLQMVSARQAAEARAQVLAAQERAAQLEMQAAVAKAQQRKRRAVMIAAHYFFKD